MVEEYDHRCAAHFNNAAIRALNKRRAERAERGEDEYGEEDYVRLCSLPHLKKSKDGTWGCHWWYRYKTLGCYADTPKEAYLMLARSGWLSAIARRYLLSKVGI